MAPLPSRHHPLAALAALAVLVALAVLEVLVALVQLSSYPGGDSSQECVISLGEGDLIFNS
jgi:hypothetical protein